MRIDIEVSLQAVISLLFLLIVTISVLFSPRSGNPQNTYQALVRFEAISMVMGFLLDGKWIDDELDSYMKNGTFERPQTQFRSKITKDGSSGFPAVPGRYHLYVSYACPWAHRTIIMRNLKKLQDVIEISIVSPLMLREGWTFEDYPGSIPDSSNHFPYLRNLYTASKSDYSGRVSVPALWDKETKQIVNNESYEIALMFNEAFHTPGTPDLYPESLREQIETINDEIYNAVNNGVYKTGLATLQDVYEENVNNLFNCLDRLEERLDGQRYLVGNSFTIADIRLFVTLIRFDPVYFVHFKCSKRLISSYTNLSNYLLDIAQLPGISETINMDHIRAHYYRSHVRINPYRIVPIGPIPVDLTKSHNRDRFEAKPKRKGRNIDSGSKKRRN